MHEVHAIDRIEIFATYKHCLIGKSLFVYMGGCFMNTLSLRHSLRNALCKAKVLSSRGLCLKSLKSKQAFRSGKIGSKLGKAICYLCSHLPKYIQARNHHREISSQDIELKAHHLILQRVIAIFHEN